MDKSRDAIAGWRITAFLMVLATILAYVVIAQAIRRAPALQYKQHGTLLNAVAADAGASSLTATIDVSNYAITTLQVELDQDTATAFSIACQGSVDGGVNYGVVQSRTIAAGKSTLIDFDDTKDAATDGSVTSLVADYGVTAYTHLKCVVTTTGGVTADTITLRATSGVGQ